MTKTIHDELQRAKPEELLEAYILANNFGEDYVRGMRMGFLIAGPDGWLQVAPAWLTRYRESLERRRDK